jgi:hypothetical protein
LDELGGLADLLCVIVELPLGEITADVLIELSFAFVGVVPSSGSCVFSGGDSPASLSPGCDFRFSFFVDFL